MNNHIYTDSCDFIMDDNEIMDGDTFFKCAMPSELFMDYFMSHMVARDLGALSLVCRALKEICDANEVWKMIYLRTLKGVIPLNVQAVHIGDRWGITTITPEGKIVNQDPRIWYGKRHDQSAAWTSAASATSASISEQRRKRAVPMDTTCGPSLMVVPIDPFDTFPFKHALYQGNVSWVSCMNDVPRTELWLYAPWRNQLGQYVNPNPTPEQVAEFKESALKNWTEYNEKNGLSTVNLCQCLEHYAIQSLNITGLKKNYKSYKRMYLKKIRTVEMKGLKSLPKKVETDKRKCQRYKKMWEEAERKKAQNAATFEKLQKKMSNYSEAIDLLK